LPKHGDEQLLNLPDTASCARNFYTAKRSKRIIDAWWVTCYDEVKLQGKSIIKKF
jgi:hypothetical protein